MTPGQRDRFDALLEEVLEDLPPRVRELLDEVPVIVEDRPGDALLKQLAADAGEAEPMEPDELCGLHTGTANTERSVERGELPSEIQLFRLGIIATAGGWAPREGETAEDVDDAVYEEIRITLLHEMGHQFGLDEQDLEELGYE